MGVFQCWLYICVCHCNCNSEMGWKCACLLAQYAIKSPTAIQGQKCLILTTAKLWTYLYYFAESLNFCISKYKHLCSQHIIQYVYGMYHEVLSHLFPYCRHEMLMHPWNLKAVATRKEWLVIAEVLQRHWAAGIAREINNVKPINSERQTVQFIWSSF